MSSPSSIKCWLARWAISSQQHASFAPASALGAWLVTRLVPENPCGPFTAAIVRIFSALFLSHLEASEITDGNVNFSYCVSSCDAQQLFVKQAHAFLKWQPQMALERERMAREMRYFADAGRALGPVRAVEYLPRIVHFDPHHTVTVMEYLAGFRVLFDVCFEAGVVPRAAAESLGTFMAHVHAATIQQGRRASAEMATTYWNPSLRAIQLEHVFTICFTDCARGRQMAKNDALMAEVAILRAKYLGYAFDARDCRALCHGDFHPGGVMISTDGVGRVKIIDPEFCAFAPPGLDVGSLMSGFIIAHLYRRQQFRPLRPETGMLELHEALELLWRSYADVMAREGIGAGLIERIAEDSVGFAMMEVCRTSLGFAGARDPSRRIASSAALATYQDVATELVRHCLVHRGRPEAEGGGMQSLLHRLCDTERLTRELAVRKAKAD